MWITAPTAMAVNYPSAMYLPVFEVVIGARYWWVKRYAVKTLQTNSIVRTDLDRFNDYPLADIGSYLAGENRPDNVIQYTSPIILGGLEINLAAIQAEETGVAVNATNQQNDNGFASGKSVSVVYGKAKWYVGAAFESNVATADTVRLAGEVTIGPVKLGGFIKPPNATKTTTPSAA